MSTTATLLEPEHGKSIRCPTAKQIDRVLRKMRPFGKCTFVLLENSDGDFLQAAGSGGGCLLERYDASLNQNFRGYQAPPVTPFEDGTKLHLSAGWIELRRDEWFRLDQVIEAFQDFAAGRPMQQAIHWRELDLTKERLWTGWSDESSQRSTAPTEGLGDNGSGDTNRKP